MTAGRDRTTPIVSGPVRHGEVARPRPREHVEQAPEVPPSDAVTFEVDLVQIGRRIWRRKLTILLTTLVGLGLATVVALVRDPTYTAFARLMLETRQVEIVEAKSVLSALNPTDEVVETEIEVILSRANKEGVAQRLGLPELLQARAAASPSLLTDLAAFPPIAAAWRWITDRSHQVKEWLGSDVEAAAGEVSPVEPVEEAIMFLGLHLGARQIGNTAVIEIAATDTDPALAARIVNAAADSYLQTQVAWKLAATSGANEWLRQRIAELEADIADKRKRLEAVRAEVGMLDESSSTLLTQRQTLLNEELLRARSERIRLETEYNEAQQAMRAGQLSTVAVMLGSGVIDQLRINEVTLAQKLAELSTIYGPRHSLRLDAENQLNAVRASIAGEVQRGLFSKQNQLAAARRKEAELEAQLSTQNASSAELGEQRILLNALQSEITTTQALLDSYRTRFKETTEQQAITRPDARVISAAVPPIYPDFPSKKAILGLAFVLSVGAGVCLAFLRDLADRTMRGPDDLGRLIHVPVLQALPSIASYWLARGSPADYVIYRPASTYAEALRSLYAAIDSLVRPSDCLRILVTSALPGEGKSSTAAALARVLQRSGKRTAIVECDLRRPRLAAYLLKDADGDRRNTRRLEDFLHGIAGAGDVVQTDVATGATLVLAGEPSENSLFLLKSPAMRELVDWLASTHDVVILDSPPVLPIADTRALIDIVDVTLFLCRWGSTRKEACLAAVQALRQPGSPPLAVAMSQVDLKRFAHYESGYSYARLHSYYKD